MAMIAARPGAGLGGRGGLAGLAGVVAVGAALRLWHLGRDDFWTDEMATLQYASSVATSYLDTHPPLYYLLVHAWLMVAPLNEVSLRLPSVILGVASIVLAYALASALFDRATGLVVAALLALSTMQIHYSQEARMYALLTFAATLSSWMLLRFLRRMTAPSALAYLLATIVLAYSHIFGLIVIFTQNLVFLYALLVGKPPALRALVVWALLQAAIACSIAPWLLYLYTNPGVERVNWIPPPSPSLLLEIGAEFASNSTSMLALLAALAALGSLRLGGRFGRPAVAVGDPIAVPFTLILLAGPVVLAIVISAVVMPVLIGRYLIACAVPFAILAAHGLTGLRPRALRWGAFAAVGMLAAWGVYGHVQSPHKLPWQELVRAIAPRVLAPDLLVFEGARSDAFDYYAERQGVLAGVDRFWIRPDGRAVPADAEARLARAVAGRERFWLIQGGTREDEQRFNRHVRQTYALGDEVSLPGVRARLFRVRR